jgi:hypothetical protein
MASGDSATAKQASAKDVYFLSLTFARFRFVRLG